MNNHVGKYNHENVDQAKQYYPNKKDSKHHDTDLDDVWEMGNRIYVSTSNQGSDKAGQSPHDRFMSGPITMLKLTNMIKQIPVNLTELNLNL